MRHEPQLGEIELHTALLSELSTAGSWENGNSVLYPILGLHSRDEPDMLVHETIAKCRSSFAQ